MNFLSHYFFDARKADPYYNFGLILPDLLRNLKSSRIRPENHPGLFTDQPEKHIVEGCVKHQLTDKNFHNSIFFEQVNQEIKKLLTSGEAEFKRIFFVYHILTEMLLDRYLLKKYPLLGEEFYQSLNDCDEKILYNFLLKFNVEPAAIQRFIEFFNHFRNSKFLMAYVDNEKFIYSLNRILTRMQVDSLDEVKQKQIIFVIGASEKLMDQKFQDLVAEMKSKEI